MCINNPFSRFVDSTKVEVEAPKVDKTDFAGRLEAFIPALDKFVADDYAKRFPNLQPDTHSLEKGPKYIRVVSTRGFGSNDRRVYCFLDYLGNIYKAESWKKPAKHVRGSLFDDNFSIGKGLNLYGAVYIR